jgi:hypothetical protein
MFFFLLIEPIILPGADRTPLRRHKCFKKNELQILHQAYVRDSHPSTDVLQQLAFQLNVSIDKVRVSYLKYMSESSILLF